MVFVTGPSQSVEDCKIPNKKVKVGRAFPSLGGILQSSTLKLKKNTLLYNTLLWFKLKLHLQFSSEVIDSDIQLIYLRTEQYERLQLNHRVALGISFSCNRLQPL